MELQREKYRKELLFIALLSVICGGYFELYCEAKIHYLTGIYTGLLNNELSIVVGMRCLCCIATFFILFLLLWKLKTKLQYIDKYRYIVGIFIIAIFTIFKLSGSSISVWYLQLGGTFQSESDLQTMGVLFGIPRAVRGDEWNVFTALNFSQIYNGFGAISEIVRGTSTDVTTTYGAPSIAIVTLFRPFLWGYFVLGNERGLAFYWISRTVFLFLASYEFGKIITKDNKELSVAYAGLITFSPAVQWWYSINAFVEMILFGQYLIVLLCKIVSTEKIWQKILICIGIIECVGGFVFTYYPAQEIPFAYAFFGVFVWLVWKKREDIRKTDIIMLVISGLIFVLMAISIILFSKDTFLAIMNTAYPGARVSTGGNGSIQGLFYWIISPFFAVDEARCGSVSFAPEMATFYSFFPMGVVWAVSRILRKKRDLLLNILVLIDLFFMNFYFFGVPEIIAKITLFSNVTENRLRVVIDFIEIVMIIRCLSTHDIEEYEDEGHRRWNGIKMLFIFVFSYFALQTVKSMGIVTSRYLWAFMWLLPTLILIFIFVVKEDKMLKLSVLLLVVSVITGIMVNPLQQGVDAVYENDLSKAIQSIVEDDPDATWISNSRTYGDYLIMNGASTINSVNVYPNIKLWEKIDEDHEYIDVYNRYAHIDIELVDTESSFEVLFDDWIKVNLNYEDISKLGIDYILSTEAYTNDKLMCVEIIDGFYIYQVQHE